jgi:hypothetical protein
LKNHLSLYQAIQAELGKCCLKKLGTLTTKSRYIFTVHVSQGKDISQRRVCFAPDGCWVVLIAGDTLNLIAEINQFIVADLLEVGKHFSGPVGGFKTFQKY